jgi:hypothetical protein
MHELKEMSKEATPKTNIGTVNWCSRVPGERDR